MKETDIEEQDVIISREVEEKLKKIMTGSLEAKENYAKDRQMGTHLGHRLTREQDAWAKCCIHKLRTYACSQLTCKIG